MRWKKIPKPGQRILRSMIGIWLCFAINMLRGGQGYVVFSCLSAVHGVQPYTKDMKPVVMKRIVGTLIGALWGLLLLLFELEVISDGTPDMGLHYLLVGLILIFN